MENNTNLFENSINYTFDDLLNLNTKKQEDIKINQNNPFFENGICFIGSISDLLRIDAINMLHILGATEKENVSKNSQYVVIGDYDASLESVKKNLKKIDELVEKGIQITTLTPEQFKDMLFTYCDYSQIVSAQDILDRISNSLNGKYKKIVKLYLKESKNVYTFVQALAKETPWHPELSGKTIIKIGVSDIVFSNYMKSVLNKLKVEYTVDSTDFYHINIEKFMKLDNSILNDIIIEALVKAFEFETFGCCSKYKECESKMSCCHDDVLYSNSCQRKAFLDSQRALRKKCGLPTTTELRYFDKEYNPHKIIQIKIEKQFTDSFVLKVYLENDKTVNVLSDYLSEMQKSDFVKTHKL